ncbi:MarR family transcriptional regulator [Amycolatopsis cynarae]|uniref:MarR family transcriptional regulator n=1 Tax=Amycolatopsis cynarae TaxID=2995223 RepID=A0ABY7B641_9PSEU|nr:MarR family transcriptional regulator [Amycolatopsis sp. HUAS 11-8]WAL66658.1 MarR family transcriptional regulator [Amycolatopsis sp. HUAS 11-8]
MAQRPPEVLASRLGYLLKHAQIRLGEAVTAALAPYGIDARELAVLSLLSAEYPLSQLEAAGKLNVDRTTMVALIDGLEDKGLVERRRSNQDRRKNIVELTETGKERLRKADAARREVDRLFLAPLGLEGAEQLVSALQVLVIGDWESAP